MTFDMLCEELALLDREYSTSIENCILFAEASWNEYLTNLEEAKLKVIRESGNTEDLEYLKGAAKEGLMVKTINAVKKIAEKLKEFIESLEESVKEFFSSAKTKVKLKELERKVNNNPKLKDKKIEIPDKKRLIKADKEVDGIFKKMYSKLKSGKDVSKDEIDGVIKEANKVANVAKAAVISVPIAVAIGLILKNDNKVYVRRPSADDILEHLGLIVDGLIPKKENDISNLDYFEKTIYQTLEEGTLHIDQIVQKAKLPVEKCLNVLMSLELNGFVETSINNYYRRAG